MRKITKAEWQSYCRHGYGSISNGQRFVLALDNATGATALEPVEVTGIAPTRQASPPTGPVNLREQPNTDESLG